MTKLSRHLTVLGLAAIAVIAFSAIGATTASASHTWWVCEKLGAGHAFKDGECKEKTGGEFEWFKLKEGETRTITAETVEPKKWGWNLRSEAEIGTTKFVLEISCETITLVNSTIFNTEREQTGKDKGKLKFTKCVVKEPAGCKVKEPIETLGEESELGEDIKAKRDADLFKPNAAGEFAKIEIEAGCIASGAYLVRGNGVACYFGANIKEHKFTHEVTCPGTIVTTTWECPTPHESQIAEFLTWKGEKLALKLEVEVLGKPKPAEFCGRANAHVFNGLTEVAWDVEP